MKHIVFFSGGVGSWAAAKRVAERHGTDDLILLFTDTLMEDEDLYRFLVEASANVGGELVKLTEGRDPWQVFFDKRFLGNSRIDPCSRILKRELAQKWITDNYQPDEAVLYLGIDYTEEHRLERSQKFWEPYRVEGPMCDAPYMDKDQMLEWLRSEGIEPPRLYTMGFPHNNCGGFCIKAGKAHFKNLLDKMPERYLYHEQKEQELREHLGKDVTILREQKDGVRHNVTLRELRERWQAGEACDPFDWGGCGCFMPEPALEVPIERGTEDMGPARRLWDAGYHDLVCVVPPDADLSESSRIDPKMRGKCPGKKGSRGWYGYNFLTERATEDDVDLWDEWNANVGLLGEYYPSLDVDSEDETLTKVVLHFAEEILGGGPVRTSRHPRRLRVYRTKEPFGRMAMKVQYNGREHLIEVLGKGRQYLVHGRHPSGVDYGWEGLHLSEYEPIDLCLISADRVRVFFQELGSRLEAKGCTIEYEGDGTLKEERPAPPQEDLYAPSLETLEEVVRSIPNTGVDFPSREDYILFGHAVKAAGAPWPQEAFDVFLEWALEWEGDEKNPDGNDPEVVARDWDRMRPPYRVGWQYLAEMSPTYCSAVDEFDADPNAIADDDPPVAIPRELLEVSDFWAAEKIVANGFANKARFVPETGRWHVWNGYAWEEDKLNHAHHYIREECIRLSVWCMERAALIPSTKSKKAKQKLERAANTFQSYGGARRIAMILESHPDVTVKAEDFDADEWLLNTPDGIVDLRTGEVLAPDPAAMLSKSTAVGPRKGDAPTWFRFLQELTGGDRAVQRFLQKLAGYCLTGSTEEQSLSFIGGPSATGKTTYIETNAKIMGTYAEEAPMDAFVHSRNDRHPTDLAGLIGARLVTAEETQHGRSWDEQRIKKITGRGRLRARFMRRDFFTYRPSFKIVVIGNAEPEIENVDEAMRRRLHLVPFENVVPEDKRDKHLPEKLESEYPQILRWMVEGALLWQREGLQPPEAVLLKTANYFADEDRVRQWFEECCALEVEGETTRADLFRVWRQWALARGYQPNHVRWFKNAFAPIALENAISTGRISESRARGYRGVVLNPAWETAL